MTKPLDKRIAVVTGASRGIGAAAALALAKLGAHVIAVARTVGGLEELDDHIREAGGTATLVPLDLKDFDGIARLGPTLKERFQRLDILVGNAGFLGALSPLDHIEAKIWDDTMTINVTANWRLIRTLDPLLRQSDAGRAVFVTSGLSWMAKAYCAPYSVSKSALDALIRTYAAEVDNTAVRVNLFSPGMTRTRMLAQAFPGADPATMAAPEDVGQKLAETCLPTVTENGRMYDFRSASWMSFRPPA